METLKNEQASEKSRDYIVGFEVHGSCWISKLKESNIQQSFTRHRNKHTNYSYNKKFR